MPLAYYLTHHQAPTPVAFRIYDGDDGGLAIVDHGNGSKLTLDVPEARQHWLALRRQGWQEADMGFSPETMANLEALCELHGV